MAIDKISDDNSLKLNPKILASFFKLEFDASDELCREIEECESQVDLYDFFSSSEELRKLIFEDYEQLKEEIKDLEKQVEDLEEEKEEFEGDIRDLESEIENLESDFNEKVFKPITLWDEQKYELFLINQEKFTPEEFENFMNSK
jgi:chromosome segregation ATPase